MIRHEDVIKWKHFPRYWPFLRGIHRWPVNSPHKGQWRWALMFCLICTWINGWVNNRKVGDLRRHRVHYDVRHCDGNRGHESTNNDCQCTKLENAGKIRQKLLWYYHDKSGDLECCLICLALWLSQIWWLWFLKIWPRMPKFIGSLNHPSCAYLMRQKLHIGTGPKFNGNEYHWHVWKWFE